MNRNRPFKIDLVGNVYATLRVLKRVKLKNEWKWESYCDPELGGCGRTIAISKYNLERYKSCGCKKRKRPQIFSPLEKRCYQAHHNMMNRVKNKQYHANAYYSTLPIEERWNGWTYEHYLAFKEDMDLPPHPHFTLDRKNNLMGYTKENCRWVPMSIQAKNKRNNIIIRGVCLADWARQLDQPYSKLYRRYKEGWSEERLLGNYLKFLL